MLVGEDHADTLELIRTVLAHAGHDVSVAVDGEDGLRRYRADRPTSSSWTSSCPGWTAST
jgi:DNA-binding response OmpR family regulator